MIKDTKTLIRHSEETKTFARVLEGNWYAACDFLKSKSSTNPGLHQIIQETVYDFFDSPRLEKRQSCLALLCCDDSNACGWLHIKAAAGWADQSGIDTLTMNGSEKDINLKAAVLTDLPLVKSRTGLNLHYMPQPPALNHQPSSNKCV